MEIKNKDDWWNLAEITIPKIEDYVSLLLFQSNGLEKRIYEANVYLKNKDHEKLHDWFEELWNALPDRVEIRFGPFFDICDLCSEYWVFDEDSPIWGIDSQLQ